MDPVTMTFYAVVCGALASAAPSLDSRWARIAAGVVVGALAANLLPLLRRSLGL